MPSVRHETRRYANNLAEVSHQPTRHRERQMRRFKLAGGAQRFLFVHGIVQNLFRVGRHLLRATNYRQLRVVAYLEAGDLRLTWIGESVTFDEKSCLAFDNLTVPPWEWRKRSSNTWRKYSKWRTRAR